MYGPKRTHPWPWLFQLPWLLVRSCISWSSPGPTDCWWKMAFLLASLLLWLISFSPNLVGKFATGSLNRGIGVDKNCVDGCRQVNLSLSGQKWLTASNIWQPSCVYFLDLPILPADISPWHIPIVVGDIPTTQPRNDGIATSVGGDAGFEELIRFLQQTRELKAKALALGEAPGLGRRLEVLRWG